MTNPSTVTIKLIGLLIPGLLVSMLACSQTIRVNGGISISKLILKTDGYDNLPLFDQKLIGYSAFVGIDYLDKKYFNLSSNVGLVRKGGKGERKLVDQHGQFSEYNHYQFNIWI